MPWNLGAWPGVQEPDEPSLARPPPRPIGKLTFLEILAVVLTIGFWAVRAELRSEAGGIVSALLALESVFVVTVTMWRGVARTATLHAVAAHRVLVVAWWLARRCICVPRAVSRARPMWLRDRWIRSARTVLGDACQRRPGVTIDLLWRAEQARRFQSGRGGSFISVARVSIRCGAGRPGPLVLRRARRESMPAG